MSDKCLHKKDDKLAYCEWHLDADKRTARGEHQYRCPVCRLWIWGKLYKKSADLSVLECSKDV